MPLLSVQREQPTAPGARTGCSACSLATTWPSLRNPKIVPDGSARPLVYFLGEAPGEADDAVGRNLMGEGGSILRNALSRWDMRANIPYRVGNICRCRPTERSGSKIEPRLTTPSEQAACWGAYGADDVLNSRPLVIVPLGTPALQRFIDGGVHEWDRVLVPFKYREHLCWLYPMHHPDYLIEQGGDRSEYYKFWHQGMDWLRVNVPSLTSPTIPTAAEITAGIEVIMPDRPLDLSMLDTRGQHIAFDVETTDLMPWAPGAKMLSASIATSEKTISFCVDHPANARYAKQNAAVLFQMLKQARLRSAHNESMEIRWASKYFGMEVFGWDWQDTMGMAYSEHGTRLQALGKRTQIHFGFNVKDVTRVDPLQWKTTPLDQFLFYGALDSKWCLRIAQQIPEGPEAWILDESRRQDKAAMAAAALSWRGMLVDQTELGVQTQKFEQQVKSAANDIVMDRQVVAWESAGHKKFNPAANDQVAEFFGLKSASEDILHELNSPLARKIVRLRKLEKMLGTYAQGTLRDMYPDGFLHPDFTTMKAVTGRWSSKKPNSQNWPKREDKTFRKVITAPKGCVMACFDFSQLEARGITIASDAPVLLQYVWDEEDIHREWAERLYDDYPEIADRLCPNVHDDKLIIKRIRGDIKTGLVFSQFYGAGEKTSAGAMHVPLGVMQPIIRDFWRKYGDVKKWGNRIHHDYDKNGYVQTLTGRRMFGPLSWTEQTNYPIQGTGSDIVVDAAVQCILLAVRENDPYLIPCINIHDDLTFYFPANQAEEYIKLVSRILVTPRFDWISVPLAIEVSMGDNWSEQNEFGNYSTKDFYKLPASGLAGQVEAIKRIARESAAHPVIGRSLPARSINAARRERIALSGATVASAPSAQVLGRGDGAGDGGPRIITSAAEAGQTAPLLPIRPKRDG